MEKMRLGGEKNKPLIVLVGATAVGKTRIALEIAQAVDGEIVGADSRQVYQGMAIGTAQPTTQQRALVPHHLVDFIQPDDNLSLARYQRMAYDCIDDIHQRGKVPLLVGGTGQYVTAVVEGWTIPEVPPNEALRAELEAFASKDDESRLMLHERLRTIDPESALNIHANNIRRVIRAIEVHHETGIPFSHFQRKNPPHYAILELGVELERQTLYKQADLRVDQMMDDGFLQEVEALLMAGYQPDLPSMSGIGYQQLVNYQQGNITLETAILETKHATHDFIRRQLTWFRKYQSNFLWHNVEQVNSQVIVSDCLAWLKG
jgi:tRNA dimethylallyltransferase